MKKRLEGFEEETHLNSDRPIYRFLGLPHSHRFRDTTAWSGVCKSQQASTCQLKTYGTTLKRPNYASDGDPFLATVACYVIPVTASLFP